MRPAAGFVLLGVSLFMLLGFFNADLPQSAVVKLLALLVGVGIPGAAGGTLLLQHFGRKNRLRGSRAQLIRQTQEAELLRLAGERGGRLTVVEVVQELALTHGDAESLLRSLVVRGYSEVEVTDTGLLVYTFPDVQLLDGKATARGVLDD
ncbi:MAG: hypothetical protein JSW71_01455 [Gemmatimonadota bacterium]|nr:MAG: hypothetical protein JSW71_01455 [Gemmatimonadota bacterium]